jgi:Resolvase, N terminal domain
LGAPPPMRQSGVQLSKPAVQDLYQLRELAKNGDPPYKAQLLKVRKEFVHGPGRVLQALSLALRGRNYRIGADVEQACDELVRKLDRLGRSLPHLIEIVGGLRARGVGFRSLTESIDTTTAMGEFLFHVFGALAQYERSLIRERVLAGLEAAKRRGRLGGRPRMLDAERLDAACPLLTNGLTVSAAARSMGVPGSTLVDSLRRNPWKRSDTESEGRNETE